MSGSQKKKHTPLPKLVSDEGIFHLCACVGTNGFQDDYQYASGYSKIPRMILQHLKENHFLGVDVLVYPLLYSARHAVELHIKEMARAIARIKAPKSEEMDNFVVRTHSLRDLWEKFRDVAVQTDKRLIFRVEKIELAVLELAELDPEGQTFRYAFDLNKKLSMEEISNINVGTFVDGFELLLAELENLHYCCEKIAAEYRTCTHTTSLSRRDLELIARTLPDYSRWREPGVIDSAVMKVMSRYRITRNQATIAISEIRQHHLFSQKIGMEQPLQHLDVAWVGRFVLRHKKLHPRKKKETAADFAFHDLVSLRAIGTYGKQKMSLVEELAQAMPFDAVADLYAVYRMGKSGATCEAYPAYFADARSKARGTDGIQMMMMDLFGDINARDWLLKGLLSLGKQRYIKGACWGHLLD